MSNWAIKDEYFDKVYGNNYKPKPILSGVPVLAETVGRQTYDTDGEARESTFQEPAPEIMQDSRGTAQLLLKL